MTGRLIVAVDIQPLEGVLNSMRVMALPGFSPLFLLGVISLTAFVPLIRQARRTGAELHALRAQARLPTCRPR